MGEMTARLAQLQGTRAEATIQVTESALNEVIEIARRGRTVPRIRLMGNNRLEVRYGMLHAHARLPVAIGAGPAPRVTLELASRVIAWALHAALRLSFLEFHGRFVTIHLAAVPALAPYRALWPHIRSARLATAPGVLRVEGSLSIEQGVRHG